MKVVLNDYVEIVNERVDISEADSNSYVSTDNLLPNRGGVDFPAKNLPKTRYVQTYKRKDILISNIRPYFKKIWLASESGTKSNDVLCFRTKNRMLLQEYLYVVLQSDNFFDYVTRTSKGTKMPRGDKDAIKQYQFDLPDLEEQFKIANSILILENKIKLNKAINDNLTSLLDCIFNNFYQYANNELSTKFETIAEIGSSNRIFAKEYKNVGIPFLRGKEISLLSQGVMPTDTLFISSERYQELKNVPNERDILITSVGTIGNIYQVEKFRLPFYYKDGNVIRITPKKGFENYIYLWLNSKLGKEAIVASTIGSTQKALTISAIKKFELLIPNSHKLEKFNDVVGPIINLIQQNHKESEDLQEVKSTLLKRYF